MRRLGRWLALCLALLAATLPAWAAPALEMTLQPANEGRVRHDGWATIMVDLTNHGGEISGQVVAEVDAEMPRPQVVVPYTLPAGGRKRIPVTLEIRNNDPIAVKLYADGELVKSQQVSFTLLAPQTALVGLLSSDELGIPGLNQVSAGQRSAQVVRLSAETFPNRAAMLDDFDVIALSRFDSASLSPEQLRALEVWVGQGGTLLLAGGPEWKRALGNLPPALVPVEVTGVREVELAPLGDLAGRPITGAGTVSEVRLKRGQALVSAGATPLVTSAPTGAGRVIFLAFDPGLTPFVTWPGQPALFTRLITTTTRGFMLQRRHGQMLQDALQRLPDWGLPAFGTVALLLGSYLLLVGPVNYLVLRRLDKREWAWVSVPTLSVLFVGVIYLVGFGRYQPLLAHQITITHLSAGSPAATMETYLGIYAPGQERLDLAVGDAPLIKPFNRGPTQKEITARVVAGDKTTVELLSLSNFGMSGFAMQRDVTLPGSLALVEAKLEGGVLTGRIANGLNQALEDVQVAVGGTAQPIGRLEAGQTSPPFRFLISTTALQGPFRGESIPWDLETEPDAPARSLVGAYVLSTLSPPPGNGLLLFGFTAEPLSSTGLPDLGNLVQGPNMVWTFLPLPTGGEGTEIPAGLVLGTPVDPSGLEELPTGSYLLPPGTHDFTILLPPFDASKVEAVELDLREPFLSAGNKVAVKNQQSGQYVPLTSQTQALSPWREFVSPAGLIELRYTVSDHLEVQPPTVAVKGVRR